MGRDVVDPAWQRLVGWLKRSWRGASDGVATVEPTVADRPAPPTSERVEAWEDEGGAPAANPAAGGSPLPTKHPTP